MQAAAVMTEPRAGRLQQMPKAVISLLTIWGLGIRHHRGCRDSGKPIWRRALGFVHCSIMLAGLHTPGHAGGQLVDVSCAEGARNTCICIQVAALVT